MFSENEPLFPFYQDKRFGFFDRNFNVAIAPTYLSGNPSEAGFGVFTEGFALVRRIDLAYVFINQKGVELPVVCWDQPKQFSEGLAAVSDKSGWGFIDANGSLVIPAQFENVGAFSNGLARVTSSNHEFLGMINQKGDWVIKGKFQYVGDFHEGCACAMFNDKWGFINLTGEWVIDPVFDGAGRFSEGLGTIRIANLWGCIDATGKIIIEPRFKFIGVFQDGLAIFHDIAESRPCGLVNGHGEVVVEPRFSHIGQFSDGLATASPLAVNDNDWPLSGMINVEGEYVIEPQFAYAASFYHGLSRVRHGSRNDFDTCYIDRAGKVVWTSFYSEDSATSFVSSSPSEHSEKSGNIEMEFIAVEDPVRISDTQWTIVGRCSTDVFKGALFSQAIPYVSELNRENNQMVTIKSDPYPVSLRVEKIESYQRVWETLNSGMVGMLTLSGDASAIKSSTFLVS